MGDLNFRDDLFESEQGDWEHNPIDEHFTQRHLKGNGPIYCETLLTVHGTADLDSAVALILGPWDWWEHGRITGFKMNPDGSSDQTLSPVWWFITRVDLHISPPAPLADRVGVRMPLRLGHHFTGPSSMDVYPGAGGDAMVIRGRFHGVEYHVPAVPNVVAEALHLEAEAGTMPVPFPKGTGWVGLLHILEARAATTRREPG